MDNQNVIKWECNNWYLRDDKYVSVTCQNGDQVILNKQYTDIWQKIDYQISYTDLLKKCDEYSETEVRDAVSHLEDIGIIVVLNESNIFDRIFG